MTADSTQPPNSGPFDARSRDCPRCLKDSRTCICDGITPLATRLHVLILQHPREPDRILGTGRIAALALTNSTLKVGLSWPNLARALGRPATPAAWGVLYLGGKRESPRARTAPLLTVFAKGQPIAPSEAALPLEGIVLLDATWKQAKSIWWRNPWLLKLRRIVLNPPAPSLYGDLRREPRRACLSTIESIALCLTALGEPPAVSDALFSHMRRLIARVNGLGPLNGNFGES
ncbi:MAG: DTW domain-containing protein [Deltaproteobacteria bacterium]|nr:DTW domain-containing protein [Deltaproteobacteria bacterium]